MVSRSLQSQSASTDPMWAIICVGGYWHCTLVFTSGQLLTPTFSVDLIFEHRNMCWPLPGPVVTLSLTDLVTIVCQHYIDRWCLFQQDSLHCHVCPLLGSTYLMSWLLLKSSKVLCLYPWPIVFDSSSRSHPRDNSFILANIFSPWVSVDNRPPNHTNGLARFIFLIDMVSRIRVILCFPCIPWIYSGRPWVVIGW